MTAALNSATVRDRRVASVTLGYAKESKEQVDALVQASRDPDDEVRNNATRALGVLLRSGRKVTAEISADGFTAMLSSGVWTDRNKGMAVLMELVASRKPELVAKLRTEALDSLIEMGSWSAFGHAMQARIILGRMAGLPDGRIMQIAASGLPAEIIEAAQKQ